MAIAHNGKSDVLILISDKKTKIIARAGEDLARFDYFVPKMWQGIIAFRGEDFQGQKAVYV